MKLAFVFILGLFLCMSLAAREKKFDKFEDQTRGMKKIEECYVGGDYFIFLYLCDDDVSYKCYLITSDKCCKEICADVKYSTACLFFPYLKDLKYYYLSSVFSLESSRQLF